MESLDNYTHFAYYLSYIIYEEACILRLPAALSTTAHRPLYAFHRSLTRDAGGREALLIGAAN